MTSTSASLGATAAPIWDNPTLALLRAKNARWILPLFAEHLLPRSDGASAEWFHARVAEASTDNPDRDSQVKPSEYCKQWVDARWLIRTRPKTSSGLEYRLSQYALRALRITSELHDEQHNVSEARLSTIAHAVSQLAQMTDARADTQLSRIDAQIAALQQRRQAILNGEAPAHSPEAINRQITEVLNLVATLPEDFRKLSTLIENSHRETIRKATFEDISKGELVELYVSEHDLLSNTPEGRAYMSFARLLTLQEYQSLSDELESIVQQPYARTQLTAAQRTKLRDIPETLLSEQRRVQQAHTRWTESLRRQLVRSSGVQHQRLIDLTDEALAAGQRWATAQPGKNALLPHEATIGGAVVKVESLAQIRLWADSGPTEVSITIADVAGALPDADQYRLKLAAAATPKAVAATINTLLETTPAVSVADIVDATPTHLRRVAILVTVLDLAIRGGRINPEQPTTVIVGSERGGGLAVTMPDCSFGNRIRLEQRKPEHRKTTTPAVQQST